MRLGITRLRCIHGHAISLSWDRVIEIPFECPSCEKPTLFIDHELDRANAGFFQQPRSFWEYMDALLPPAFTAARVSLGEGNTPVAPGRSGAALANVFFKDESMNPTKSYRDRAAALLVSHAKALQFRTVCAASNGNLGASLSAYAASAGLVARVHSLVNMDIGKKSQVLTYGGVLFDSHPDYNSAVRACVRDQEREGGYQATSELNPLVILAQQTIAYEMFASKVVPDEIYVSVGNGGTLFSIWKGFNDLALMGLIKKVPEIIGAEVSGDPATKISDLKESSDVSQRGMMYHAIDSSGGEIVQVTDEDISNTIPVLARAEGYFVEPASAAAYAALLARSLDNERESQNRARAVILTATGLKAPIIIDALAKRDGPPMEKVFHARMNLRLHILEQLLQAGTEGLHGYGIYTSIKKEMNCTKQAIYLHLKQLHEKRFIDIVHTDPQGRKIYTITRDGMEILDLLKKLMALL